MSQTVLDTVLTDAKNTKNSGEKVQFIFDLDSTLYCISPRTELILKTLANEPSFKNQFPSEAKELKQVSALPTDWGVKSILARAEIKGTITLFDSIRQYWIEQFFASHHLHVDAPYPGAVDFVNLAKNLGFEIKYLTGRDQPRMQTGTLASLADHKFPLVEKSHLNMKPNTEISDVDYKVEFFASLDDQKNTWFFENEPVIINQVLKTFPEVKIVFMDSVHSGRETVPEHVPRIKMAWEFSHL